ARVEDRVPLAIPREQLRVLREALRKMLFAESLENRRVIRVRLRNERRWRRVVLLLAPMDGDLRFGETSVEGLLRRGCSVCRVSHYKPLLRRASDAGRSA